ncbi:hypothetical protein WR164_12420 [Philodulcilactobacillus myokoensis]|uniref:Metalloenzyme domain-containing protein n=1 Tax=Philodulcilactobacillus myokoensis TaxID=2929573 RepID=A0A9W6B2N0_9LACO|nr:hypothetical protein [Philodulcilactobacillus myokoensis]GLB47263.1 hypothetical protein WR164_12420 [Philodulcilactobacillus myokoensis]
MKFRRVIIIDIASLGLGATADADRFNSTGADTLGHLDQHFHSTLKLPTLTQLGLGNIRADHPVKSVPAVDHPWGFFGSLINRVQDNTPNAGIREMLDIDMHCRIIGVLNELIRRNFSVTVISPLENYLIDQDWAKQIQASDDDMAYSQLMVQLKTLEQGLIYFQPPVIRRDAYQHQMRGYKANLEVMDKQLGILFEKLDPTDMVIVTSSFANDPTFDQQYTREKLPLLIYSPAYQNGKSIGDNHYAGDIGKTIIDIFKRHSNTKFAHSLLPLIG